MRCTFILLLITFLSFPGLKAYAQYHEDSIYNQDSRQSGQESQKGPGSSANKHAIRRAGDKLVEFGVAYYTGVGVSVGGFVLSIIGANDNNGTIVIGGTLLSVGGYLYTLLSFRKIKDAGEILRQAKLNSGAKRGSYWAVSGTRNGIGLTYHF